jgi:GNAT superfamily N-acetyltransferase
VTWALRRIGSDEADLSAVVAIVNTVNPEYPTSLEETTWGDATYPGAVRFLAEESGRPVGAATVGRIWMLPPEFDGLWATIDVLPEARRRGIGGAMYAAISETARERSKTTLFIDTQADRPQSVAFLEHRGFVETDRYRMVALDLRGLDPPVPAPPPGITITTLADRPDLLAAVYDIAVETYPDVPSSVEPMATGTYDEFVARDVDRPGMPRDAFFVAVDDAVGKAVGWASLLFKPGSSTVAYHDMTTVARAWRGRGIATALKRATIAWAIRHGLELLETGNDVSNAPMRAVNRRLGYEPRPDHIEFRGPLAAVAGSAGAG